MAQPLQQRPRTAIRLTVIILVIAVVLIVGMVIARQIFLVPQAAEAQPAPELSNLNTFVYDEGRPLAAFNLTDEQGEPVTNAALKGHWTFAFVGYTYCPDVCPATLSILGQAEKKLPDAVPDPTYLLVSADPERDTPARLADYLSGFGPHFHGVTGNIDTLRALAKSLNAAFSHRTDENGNVLVDHSAHLALINPDGQMIAIIQQPLKPDTIAEAFEQIYYWSRSR